MNKELLQNPDQHKVLLEVFFFNYEIKHDRGKYKTQVLWKKLLA